MVPDKDDWVEVVSASIDVTLAHDYLARDSAHTGATVVFLGRVREFTYPHNTGYSKQSPLVQRDGQWVVHTPELIYECYPEMATRAMTELLAAARSRWPLQRLILQHRVGRLAAGEIAILIGVSSSHRGAAYAANEYLIEEVKQRVPVWKQEIYTSGAAQWVHPIPTSTAR
ncbi:MAG: molybdenum cofactor biosynthesis protein MoaE [Planctomycetaceae bacterium]|nr:molybdenum cofactor biosynthesis protein MoaE [Planctomycetaceae bacterium]